MQQPVESLKKVGHYILGQTIGRGSFGKVKQASHEFTGIKVAIKIINKAKMRSKRMITKTKREIRFLKYLSHPNIIKLYEVLDNNSYIFVVMELATKGQLYDLVQTKGKFEEPQAQHFFKQILVGLNYCHQKLVTHRDLKLQNILMDENDNLKIGDFGLSNIMKDGKFLKTSCGSPHYASPQITTGRPYQGTLVDIWSCGIILYVLLTGQLPFNDQKRFELFKKIQSGVFTMPEYLSRQVKDLLKSMICIDPSKRISIQKIFVHPWLNNILPLYALVIPFYGKRLIKKQSQNQQILQTVIGYGLQLGGRSPEMIEKAILNRQQDSFIVTYQLLCDQKHRALVVQQNTKQSLLGTYLNKLEQKQQQIQYNAYEFGHIYKSTAKNLTKRLMTVLNRMGVKFQLKSKQYKLKCSYIINKHSIEQQINEPEYQDELVQTLMEQARSQKAQIAKHGTNQLVFYIQIYEIDSKHHMMDFQLSKGHAILFLGFISHLHEQLEIELEAMSVIL